MTKRKKKEVNPDDYFSNGLFEIARFGKNIILHNMMTPEIHEQYLKTIANGYEESIIRIDTIVQNIRSKVSKCNPEMLMNFLVSIRLPSMLNKSSELHFSMDENIQLHTVEYIQSVLVASENHYIEDEDDQSELYFEILEETKDLYMELMKFIFIWGTKIHIENPDEDQQILEYIIQSQLFYWVRGQRYQVFQIPFLDEMLSPFDKYFQEIYSIEAENVIEGLRRLEKSLSSGKLDAVKKLFFLMDGLKEQKSTESANDFLKENQNYCAKAIKESLGLALYDIKEITGWPEKFIDDLTYSIGENKELYEHTEFAGWPLWNLPVERRPFIRIKEKSYCFDYYVLFDNIYRAIQRAIRNKEQKYADGWGKIQQEASEKIVEKLFKKLLPDCVSYRGNYYQKDDENDILILYKDVILIIEVKAGAFTFTPAMTDFEAHKKSFEELVNKAGDQCFRLEKYLKANSPAIIYDSPSKKKKVKAEIDLKNYTQIYSFCVTVDDFNTFAAHAEKLGFVRLQNGTISISINDLWVYSEYFTSPIQFIHFLKQRKTATQVQELALIDELDHLGLYIENNMYSLHATSLGQGHTVNYTGYREELDKYFSFLYYPTVPYCKPVQDMPDLFHDIIKCYEIQNGCLQETEFTNFMLDFSIESKRNFSNNIMSLLERGREIGGEVAGINVQDGCYCVFVMQPGVKAVSDAYKTKYAQGLMLYHDIDECYLIEMLFDSGNRLEKIKHILLKRKEIPCEKYEELYKFGVDGVKHRMQTYLRRSGQKKIYPNDLCPCGSGKKYKKCCGKIKSIT